MYNNGIRMYEHLCNTKSDLSLIFCLNYFQIIMIGMLHETAVRVTSLKSLFSLSFFFPNKFLSNYPIVTALSGQAQT